MPIISRFFGIVIFMNYNDHLPPHFHARYQDQEITVEIESGLVQGEWHGASYVWCWNGLKDTIKNYWIIGTWQEHIEHCNRFHHWTEGRSCFCT